MTDDLGQERVGLAGSAPTGQAVRALVVDDDPSMLRMVTDYLRNNGLIVTAVARRTDSERHLASAEFNLVILDLRLGMDDGLDVLRSIRAKSDVPIIIVTGHARDEIDRVVGLELGADDYITKPFGLRELLARVRAVLRRHEKGHAALIRQQSESTSRFGGWSLCRRAQRLTDPRGQVVALTKGEYGLLVAFLQAPQKPLSREHLLQATRVHGDIFDRSIDVQILRLRRKLEVSSNAPKIIQTLRGIGYVFALPVETNHPLPRLRRPTTDTGCSPS